MKKYFFILLLLSGSLACATVEKALNPGEAPTIAPLPTEAFLAPTPEAVAPEENRDLTSDIYCSSEIQAAVDAYNQAVDYDLAGDTQSAIQAYQTAIELDPEYCDAMDNLALLYRKEGNYQEAQTWYERSIAVAPDNNVSHMGLANNYMDLDEYDNALKEYNELLRINPNDPEGYYGAGRVYFSLEQYQDAIIQFKQAEELYKAQDSEYVVDAQVFIGISYVVLEEYEQGRDYLELTYPQMQNNEYVNYFLGSAYYYGESIRDDALAKQYLLRARELGIELEPELENFVNTP